MSADAQTLGELVAEVLASLRHEGARVFLPEDARAGFVPRFRTVPASERTQTLIDLVAAAAKLKRLGGEAANDAILALCDLAAVVESKGAADKAFSNAGLPTSDQLRVTGNERKLTAPTAPTAPAPALGKGPSRGLKKS